MVGEVIETMEIGDLLAPAEEDVGLLVCVTMEVAVRAGGGMSPAARGTRASFGRLSARPPRPVAHVQPPGKAEFVGDVHGDCFICAPATVKASRMVRPTSSWV